MRSLLIVCLVLLTGCATKYQSMGRAGGVSSEQMTSDTFRIVARGNGYTNASRVQDYMLLKAAETTKEHGGTHFIVISAADTSRRSQIATPGYAQTSVIGNTAMTTYTPGMPEMVVKPGQDAYIQILTLNPSQPVPPGAVSADEIVKFIGSRVERS